MGIETKRLIINKFDTNDISAWALIECDPNLEAREAAAEDVVNSKSATFIHPSNNLDVILGQGTATKELIEQYGSFDHILVPIGGGGLIAGSALSAKYFGDNCTVVGTCLLYTSDAADE